jgi:plastocyanin
MKKIILFQLLIIFSLALLAQVHVITQESLSFNPNSIEVNVGDTIRWEWTVGSHTTTSLDIPEGAASWDSPLNSTNTFFEYKVLTEGVYNYKCTPHQAMGMIGSFTAVLPLTTNSISTNFLSIYPNPASDVIFIETESLSLINIYNISGQKIINLELSDSQSINIEQLESGIYLIEVMSSGKKISDLVKIVKL